MTSNRTQNGGKEGKASAAIRDTLSANFLKPLKPRACLVMTDWAMECEDAENRAALLAVFERAGGPDLLGQVIGHRH